MDAGFCIQIVLFATPAPLPQVRYNFAVYHDLYQLGSWKESLGRQGNHIVVITRKVSPPELFSSGGRSFFCKWFLKNGKRMAISRHIVVISLTSFTKKAPAHRGFLGSGIVPTGELEGREDIGRAGGANGNIVPTGELEGREDLPLCRSSGW